MKIHLNAAEFRLLQAFIEERCGITVTTEKAYLIESRLSRTLHEAGLGSFSALYERVRQPDGKELAQKVIDAITTHETYWFRDKTPWAILEEILLPQYVQELQSGSRRTIRIWSAACSTGQEPYSIAMLIHRFLAKNKIHPSVLGQFEIIASDISQAVLAEARDGCYDCFAISRGLDASLRERYFRRDEDYWRLQDVIRQAVVFQVFNLQHSFAPFGQFDVVFFRYVAIYFAGEIKRRILEKMAAALTDRGVLFLGNAEVMLGYQDIFQQEQNQYGVFYRAKR